LQVIRSVSATEGNFIAGFVEGEGHFGIAEQNGGQSYGCFMSLGLRDDDAPLARWLCERTGLGVLSPVPSYRTSKPQVRWQIRKLADCRQVIELLDRYELRGRKRREYEIWRTAVELASSGISGRRIPLRRLHERLRASRVFRVPGPLELGLAPVERDALVAYLHGLLCAEGSFSLRPSHAGLSVHLRQDDRPLLAMLAGETGLGYLRDSRAYPPAQASTFWRITSVADVTAAASWLDPDLMRGRKANELRIWLAVVAEFARARSEGVRPDKDRLASHLAAFRAARRYRPPTDPLPAPEPRADTRADDVAALQRWAATERGALSCRRYAEYRAEADADLPTRNTLARRFGSWNAALAAAGLADRAASTAQVRRARSAGGVADREARAQAQRERVLATLRYGVNRHGHVPTAMQFFRWRLVEAPATPTQATVYRLFPGGWPAVIAAYEAAAQPRGDVPAGVVTADPAPA
jgi:hypothetical protein